MEQVIIDMGAYRTRAGVQRARAGNPKKNQVIVDIGRNHSAVLKKERGPYKGRTSSGSLTQYGYSTHNTLKERRKALTIAVAVFGKDAVIKKLRITAQYNLKQPARHHAGEILWNDHNWTLQHFGSLR